MSPAPRRPTRGCGTPGPGANPELTDWLLAGLAGVLAFGAVLWAGGAAATLLTSGRLPDGGITAALLALAHVGDPAAAWGSAVQMPGPALYWSVSGAVVVVAAAGGALV
ncbi:hypothetical protein BH11ACT1_BH11ACT1_07660 [soil metagenome]